MNHEDQAAAELDAWIAAWQQHPHGSLRTEDIDPAWVVAAQAVTASDSQLPPPEFVHALDARLQHAPAPRVVAVAGATPKPGRFGQLPVAMGPLLRRYQQVRQHVLTSPARRLAWGLLMVSLAVGIPLVGRTVSSRSWAAATPPPPATGPRSMDAASAGQRQGGLAATVATDVGMVLLEPTFLPDGCTFRDQIYRRAERAVVTNYRCISIEQQPARGAAPVVGADADTVVMINGTPAAYRGGGWVKRAGESEPHWHPEIEHALLFETQGVRIRLTTTLIPMSKDELIRIAEGLH